MERLDSLDSRKLLRFFRSNKTELSRLKNSDMFLGKMQDCDLIPENKYEEVRRIRKEARRNKAIYDILEWFEKEKPQDIKLFWKCLFQETLMEQCPTLRNLCNKLMSDSKDTQISGNILFSSANSTAATDGSDSCSPRNGCTPRPSPPPSACGTLLQPSPLSTMTQTLGPSTRSIYIGLAFVSLLLHLLLALFCLSVLQKACVLQTACVLPPTSSTSSSKYRPQQSPRQTSGHQRQHTLHAPGTTDKVRGRTSDGAGEVSKIVKGHSKLEALFRDPLYNLLLPELQEDDWLLKLTSEEDWSEEYSEESNSVEEGYFKLDWTTDVKSHPPWLRFHLSINRWQLYDRNDPNIAELSHYLATQRIIGAVQMSGGTQIKLILSFPNHGEALLKPMKQSRETELNSNIFYFNDFDRHNAEIAAFHLDRVLGFNRIPPTVGRLINVTTDVREITTDRRLAKTFYSSPAGNVCFHGACSQYCSTESPICGQPHALEVSLAVMLPDIMFAPRRSWRSPWKRSYSRTKSAWWEMDSEYCDQVKETPPYNIGTRLVDVMDMVILDFLMSNMDRHHYETFERFDNETILLHLDNGRSFGCHSQDEPSILVPLQQCCRIRLSTLLRLKLLSSPDFRLSDVMRESLAQDPLAVIAPLLTEPHLSALDRRLATVLQVVKTCQEQREDVIFDDVEDFDTDNAQQPNE